MMLRRKSTKFVLNTSLYQRKKKLTFYYKGEILLVFQGKSPLLKSKHFCFNTSIALIISIDAFYKLKIRHTLTHSSDNKLFINTREARDSFEMNSSFFIYLY